MMFNNKFLLKIPLTYIEKLLKQSTDLRIGNIGMKEFQSGEQTHQ